MNVSQTYATPASTPECFGKSWDPKDVDCTGGFNAAYSGPNGSKMQPKCDFFEACKGRVTLKRIEELRSQGNLIRPEALLRAQQSAAQMPTATVPTQQVSTPAQVPAQMPVPPPAYGAPQMQPGAAVPAFYPLPYGMPAYYPPPSLPVQENVQFRREALTPSPTVHPYIAVQEKRRKGESLMKPLGREMMRAGLKAMGQTFANYWDFVPLGEDE